MIAAVVLLGGTFVLVGVGAWIGLRRRPGAATDMRRADDAESQAATPDEARDRVLGAFDQTQPLP